MYSGKKKKHTIKTKAAVNKSTEEIICAAEGFGKTQKKTKGGELTQTEKLENRRISRERIRIENINAKIKVFKIMANRYRNRRKRHSLRTNLICEIVNADART